VFFWGGKLVLNRDKKEVCTGWILFNKISEFFARNQNANIEYHNNPFVKK